jgi:hypothetical protein
MKNFQLLTIHNQEFEYLLDNHRYLICSLVAVPAGEYITDVTGESHLLSEVNKVLNTVGPYKLQ